MKTLRITTILVFFLAIYSAKGQEIKLKKLNPNEISKIKLVRKTPLAIIPFKKMKVGTTEVTKSINDTEKDKLKPAGVSSTNGEKNCTPSELSYKICSDKLTPISSTMGIKLGNVYDLNEFKNGQYSSKNYTFLNEGLVSVGGNSTSNQVNTKVEKGTSSIDFQISLNLFTNGVPVEYRTQKMSQNFKLIYATSKKQLNANLGMGYSDVIGNEANINSTLDISSDKQNYTAIYKEENYSEKLDMTSKLIDTENPNLVYVSEVVYGKLGFFDYSTNANLLKFGLKADGSFNYNGAQLSSNLEVNAMQSDEEGEITSLLFGSKSNSQIPTDKDAFIRWANETPSTNSLVPVGFVLKFVDDNSTAYFVTSGTEPVQVCAPKPTGNRRYDVKIKLSKLDLNGVCEGLFDDTEDLWGKQSITYIGTISNGKSVTKLTDDKVMWEKSEKQATTNNFKDKDTLTINTEYVLKNLTEEEIKNLNIWFGGKIYDYEPTGSPKYNCKNCSEPQDNPFKRKFRVKENQETINSIDQLELNKEYKKLTTGDDMILIYNECNSKVKLYYEIYAKSY
jgi:hypothetical protein